MSQKKPKPQKILLVDNDQELSKKIETFLSKKGFEVEHLRLGKKVINRGKKLTDEVIVSNYKMRDMDGVDFLSLFRKKNQHTPIVFISRYDEVQFVVKCMRRGAFDYVTKPIQPEEVIDTIEKAFAHLKKTKAENKKKKTSAPTPNESATQTPYIEGESHHAKQVMKNIDLVAPTDFSVIVQGETGTGKEFVARRIHKRSERVKGPFVALDCGALPKELAGSELFGHKKGSFTGAIDDKIGAFERAHNGTLFLDEVGNLSFDHQLKLLRVLQEKKIKPIGSNRSKAVNVRVIAATNDNLKKDAKEGVFREDLYYRLNEFKFELDPLRDRGDDLFLFAEFFLDQTNQKLGKKVNGFSHKAKMLMQRHSWPGNLRELKNAVKRAALLCKAKKIEPMHLPIEVEQGYDSEKTLQTYSLKKLVEQTEKKAIKRALESTRYNKSKTAELLEIDRKTLYLKMDLYGIR